DLLDACTRQENAEHGDGFWVDHWVYNLDALEAYLAIYPEKLKDVLIDKHDCVYFNNFVKVKPRDEKYVLYDNMVRQYHSVSMEEIEEGSHLSKQIGGYDWAVKTDYGKGDVLKTTILGKIVCLATNKMASLDAFGCGIEMEANKPGWYDALNGLPGMFGSSVCETFELKRLIDFVLNALSQLRVSQESGLSLPVELFDFLNNLTALLDEYALSSRTDKDMVYWDKSYGIKEEYRKKVYHGVSGATSDLKISALCAVLKKMSAKLSDAIQRSQDGKNGLYHTYFINEVTDYEKIQSADGFKKSKDGLVCVRPKKFKQYPLPLFLEAQVHALRCEQSADAVRELYQNTRKSALYDKALKMYKVNASLEKITGDIGRARAFTPGWLENESIWLHMEYKFILELLRHGLNEEFFAEFKNVLIPFQPAERYGRSILENSSFLVSSAFPDESLHGNGFVARLSGSTAEFITMWLWMNVGQSPFRINKDNQLVAEFAPKLPAWMFTKKEQLITFCAGQGKHLELKLPKNSYAFNFLTTTLVVYHNPKAKNTYGSGGVKPISMKIAFGDEKSAELPGGVLPTEYAVLLREGKILKVEVELG
ncbi:MAG: hypothetical protein PHV59_11100, partial [Victivallales bacterium]|nr:hypothetical protein [Victivallales bacterium]